VAIPSSRYKNKVEGNLQRETRSHLARIEQLVDAANGREPSSLMLPENRRQVFESLENPEISS
jgi:hypothetical protein